MLLIARLVATHLQPYSTKTGEEEQMSLSAEIKNHYSDSFTNSFVGSAVEDGWRDAVDVLIRSLIFTGTCGASHRAVVTFRQPPITYVSVTLHAAVNTSLPVITRESGVVILLEASYIPVRYKWNPQSSDTQLSLDWVPFSYHAFFLSHNFFFLQVSLKM